MSTATLNKPNSNKSKLVGLKSQLRRLRNARDGVRFSAALTGVLFWLAGTLAVWFTLDYGLNLSPMHRILMIAISLPVVVYGISRSLGKLHGWGATLIDTAISVEHRHGIDGDLVAAIQFEQGDAIGSSELQNAVVDYVAELKNEIDIFDGFDAKPTRNRFIALGLLAVLAIGFYFFAPNYVSTFLDRLAMGGTNYPTSTQIASVQINGQEVDLSDPSQAIKLGYGNPLDLVVMCAGRLPKTCRIVLEDQKGESTEEDLAPTTEADDHYAYSIPRLIQPLTYQVYAGDTQTPQLSIEIIPLPSLKVELAATPPDYAKNIQLSSGSSSTHLAVLAGSNVSLKAVADRELLPPTLILRHGTEQETLKLVPEASGENTWTIDGSIAALTDIQETATYELTATDTYGLQPASPIRGTIRVVPDRLPTASLQTIHHIVLATASPVIRYRAADDFGLSKLSLVLEIRRADTAPRVVEVPLKTFATNQPAQKTDEGDFPLDLSPWQLEVGDLVQVTLQATDFRAGADEMVGHSDPIHLEIGDESTVLAAIAEADKQSEQMLSELIQQQLGLGENP